MLLDHNAIDIEAACINPHDAPAVGPGVVLPLSQSVVDRLVDDGVLIEMLHNVYLAIMGPRHPRGIAEHPDGRPKSLTAIVSGTHIDASQPDLLSPLAPQSGGHVAAGGAVIVSPELQGATRDLHQTGVLRRHMASPVVGLRRDDTPEGAVRGLRCEVLLPHEPIALILQPTGLLSCAETGSEDR